MHFFLARMTSAAYLLIMRFDSLECVRLLTISTLTSPTFVAPCALRKFLTRSCSFGILSARIPLKSVLSAEMFRTHVAIAGNNLCFIIIIFFFFATAAELMKREEKKDIFKDLFTNVKKKQKNKKKKLSQIFSHNIFYRI